MSLLIDAIKNERRFLGLALLLFTVALHLCGWRPALSLLTQAISKTSTSNSKGTAIKFCGIYPRKRKRGLHPATEERFWCGYSCE